MDLQRFYHKHSHNLSFWKTRAVGLLLLYIFNKTNRKLHCTSGGCSLQLNSIVARSSNESYTLRHLRGWGPSLSFSVEEFSIVPHKESLSWGDLKYVCICLSDLQSPFLCWPLFLHKHTTILISWATSLKESLKFFELIIHRQFAKADAFADLF